MTGVTVRRVLHSLLLAAVFAEPAFALELRNDSWLPGGSRSFVGLFDTGDVVAARLLPLRDCPCEVTSISFLYGGGSTNSSSLTVRVWDDPNGTVMPGSQRFSRAVEVTPDDDGLFVLDLSSDPLTVNGPFRVGIILEDDGFPAVAADSDGAAHPERNFVLEDGTWKLAGNAGVDGDWIIRATIEGGAELPCASPVTGNEEPEASDCLFILRSAVGQLECEPACICDPSGNGDVSAADALVCLKSAVGQNQALDCPCD